MRQLVRQATAAVATLLLLGGAVAACSESDDSSETNDAGPVGVGPSVTPPAPVKTATEGAATVGAAGGNVTTTDGTGVEIPAGALPNNVQVSVKESPALPPPANATPVGSPYVFGPSGLKFAQPVTVVLEIDPAKLPPGKAAADVVVFTAPDGTTNYEALPTTVRDATHVTAQTTHFSIFVPSIRSGDSVVDAGPDPNDAGCTPTTLCGDFGPGACGLKTNNCGAPMDCGACSGGGDAGVDGGPCQPLTCANYAASNNACGPRDDGCGATLQCTQTCLPDGGPAPTDAGPKPDGGGGATDGGPGPSDGGVGPTDAGPKPDGGGGAADGGPGPSDGGVGPSDAGPKPDGGGGVTDGGAGPSDGGVGPSDGGAGPFAHCPGAAIRESEVNDDPAAANTAPNSSFDFCGAVNGGDNDYFQFTLPANAASIAFQFTATPGVGFALTGTADGAPFAPGESVPFAPGKLYVMRVRAGAGDANYNVKVTINLQP